MNWPRRARKFTFRLLLWMISLVAAATVTCFTEIRRMPALGRRCRQRNFKTVLLAAKPWKKLRLQHDQILPELIVLDLDNTIWTPELYQLNLKKTPRARKDIHLFADVPTIFETVQLYCDNVAESRKSAPRWAIASRAQNVDWAMEFLQEFRLDKRDKNSPSLLDLFDANHIQIQGGTKKRHFQCLREQSGIPYHKMVFFDDWEVNLQEVSQLGVLSCHCPRGLTLDIFQASLRYYHDLKSEDENNWCGYVI